MNIALHSVPILDSLIRLQSCFEMDWNSILCMYARICIHYYYCCVSRRIWHFYGSEIVLSVKIICFDILHFYFFWDVTQNYFLMTENGRMISFDRYSTSISSVWPDILVPSEQKQNMNKSFVIRTQLSQSETYIISFLQWHTFQYTQFMESNNEKINNQKKHTHTVTQSEFHVHNLFIKIFGSWIGNVWL